MSLNVRHLNADSTFLLTFNAENNASTLDKPNSNNAYTILIDPWLEGISVVSAEWFSTTKLQIPSAIKHLSEIDPPDVVIISQNKPDHCHKKTLLQLQPEAKTLIVAEPSAARHIKSWNHFDPHRVQAMAKYDPKARFGNSIRLYLPPLSPAGHPGEVTISFIPAKYSYSVTGLHNAIGITYQPPTHVKMLASVKTIDLPRSTKYFHMPLSPAASLPPSSPISLAMSPASGRPASIHLPLLDSHLTALSLSSPSENRPPLVRAFDTDSSENIPQSMTSAANPSSSSPPPLSHGSLSPPLSSSDGQATPSDAGTELDTSFFTYHLSRALPTPPDSPKVSVSLAPGPYHKRKTSAPSHQKSISTATDNPKLSPASPARPKVLSIIYSPHGLPFADLQPYVRNHLVRLPGALPLTLLLHSFDLTQNPWYMGGNITTGAEGGVEIAQALMARCWLSAHDEEKIKSGFSVRQLKIRHIGVEDVRKALWQGEQGEWLRKTGWTCDVRSLEVGKDICLGPSKDLCAGLGISGNRDSRLMKIYAG